MAKNESASSSTSAPRNPGIAFDEAWLRSASSQVLSEEEATMQCGVYAEYTRSLPKAKRRELLLKSIGLCDLTSLAGDDTPETIQRLCARALEPLKPETVKKLGLLDSGNSLHCASVCVYPARVLDVKAYVAEHGASAKELRIASVAGGFPSGQYKLSTRLEEIRLAVEDGANEIDTVINRCAALLGKWRVVYDEVKEMRRTCGDGAILKTILATGELKTVENVYKASLVAMMAGSDFIKTSTGKETVNATLPVSLIMCRAIKDYHAKTGIKVGFKPAGGIKSGDMALNYLYLVQQELGDEWIQPSRFRFGASSLVDDIERLLVHA